VEAQKATLRQRFEHSGWECVPILRALDSASDLYFDRVSQIRMGPDGERWTQGRVALIGDAAFCVSLLAGEGSGLAMVAAYILAGELHRANGDYPQAFSRYKTVFAPFVQGKQEAARRLARAFAPRSAFELFFHNQFFNLLNNPWIVRLAFARGLKDNILLPEYDQSTAPRS
jgi:2-polyprenyl-6-methoxyphenol hydroxylase-like FAD-dependent oxidoreductase